MMLVTAVRVVVRIPQLILLLTIGWMIAAPSSTGMATNAARLAAQGDPSVAGQWSSPIVWPTVAIHLHLLPNRKLLAWSNGSTVFLDPDTGTPTGANLTTNVFCSGHSLLPDGRLLVTGGLDPNGALGEGVSSTNIFDYSTGLWTQGPNMNLGRWYPTNCALANGETVVLSGLYCSNNCGSATHSIPINPLPQVWQTAGGWRSLTGAQRSDLSTYPWLVLAPDGRAFYAGPESSTRFLDSAGFGAWSNGPATTSGVYRDYGTCVMYEPGKVLIMGGGNVPDPNPNLNNRPTNSAEVIDLNLPSPAWRAVGSMAFRRRQTISTIIADGKVLVTGGTSGTGFNNPCDTVLAAEIWNPATEAWSTMASMQNPRIYHQTAALLPDGRVVVAGSTAQPACAAPPAACYSPCSTDQPAQSNAEIYSPPYLFNSTGALATRPTILSAPATITYGQRFSIQTAEAASITKVTWVRLSSATHSFNQNQRFNRLNFQQATGGLTVSAPVNPNLCPPGDYMLFIINSSGVPSVASIMRVSFISDTIGLYDPAHATFFLRNSNTGGVADNTFTYGGAGGGFIPLVGDWNGDGVKTVGLYDPATATFFLRNSNTGGFADITFKYGPAGLGWVPIVGDWDGDGIDTTGLYNPANAAFFLRNSNTTGIADISFNYGPAGAGWIPIAGDWNGDGLATVGLYNPATGGFFLKNSNTSGVADILFLYGAGGAGITPISGDWNADGVDTIGLYDPAHATFSLRNSNTGGAPDVAFTYGGTGGGFVPITGHWQ